MAAEGVMRVELTYTEEADIQSSESSPTAGSTSSATAFSLRATGSFEQRVTMEQPAGAGVVFNPAPNSTPKYSGGVTYKSTYKIHGTDEKGQVTLDEVANLNFAGVLAPESGSGVPDDNAASMQVRIQAEMKGGCKGTISSTDENGKHQFNIDACWGGEHNASIPFAPLDVSQHPRQSDGQEVMGYLADFAITSCSENPEYCRQLQAQDAGADAVPNAAAMGNKWIGGTKTGTVNQGYKFSSELSKELRVPEGSHGTWKRFLKFTMGVTPGTKAALRNNRTRDVEIADRVRLAVPIC